MKQNKDFSKIGLTILVILLLLIILFFSRFGVLSFYINRRIHHFNRNDNIELRIQKISFTGINGVNFDKVLLLSKTYMDTLLSIDSIAFKIKLLSLLSGNMNFQSLELANVRAHLIDNEEYNNFSFFFTKQEKSVVTNIRQKEKEGKGADLSDRFNNLLINFFKSIPYSIKINNFSALFELQREKAKINLKILRFKDNKIDKTILDVIETNINSHFSPPGIHYSLMLEGSIDRKNDPDKIGIELRLYSNNVEGSHLSKTRFYIPILYEKYNLKLAFDTLNIRLTKNNFRDDKLNLTGLFSASGVLINHPKVAQNDINIDRIAIRYNINIGKNYYELDSLTDITYNKLVFNPYIKYFPETQDIRHKTQDKKSLTIIVNKNRFESQDFFESLPPGLFSNLSGIKTKGELEYHLKFSVVLSTPDSLIFSSNLVKHNFKIFGFGQTDFSKLNSSFLYTAYDKGNPVKTFTIGPENPEFIALKNIPLNLIYSVLTSEDGGYFIHRGFNADAFRESLIKNIKEKRFARGGSTITMQLVKNVFLNRNKNIARKLEEVIIVWLIENNNLSNKQRMLEVYLNIIEWGPGIYGIAEASEFYFKKKPSQLSLAECIFLANIISHPKWYKYSFDENGNLNDNVKGFYKLVSEKMFRKEYITQNELDHLIPEVKLKGNSLKFLMKDTLGRKINIDSLFKRTDEEL